MTKTNIKFNDITNVNQLRDRIENGYLSVGNKMAIVRKFATEIRISNDQVEATVAYTPQHGLLTRTWFV